MYISIYLCIYRWANDDDDDTSLLFTILKTYTLKSLVIIYIYIYGPNPQDHPQQQAFFPSTWWLGTKTQSQKWRPTSVFERDSLAIGSPKNLTTNIVFWLFLCFFLVSATGPTVVFSQCVLRLRNCCLKKNSLISLGGSGCKFCLDTTRVGLS